MAAACTAVSPTATPTASSGHQCNSMNNLHNGGQGFHGNESNVQEFQSIVTKLSGAGYDTTDLSALIKAGDWEKIKSWLDTFNTAHPGVLPTPEWGGPIGEKGQMGDKGKFCDSNHTASLVSIIQKAGYDTTELSNLIAAGNCSQVMSWVKTFTTAHPGLMPTPPMGGPRGEKGQMGDKGKFCDSNHTASLVSIIQKVGYDTTEISALLKAGDKDKIKAWIDSFNMAHPGVLPTPRVKGTSNQ